MRRPWNGRAARAFFLFVTLADGIAEETAPMDTIWEKYRAFAATSLAMAPITSSVKEIATLLEVAQFWV